MGLSRCQSQNLGDQFLGTGGLRQVRLGAGGHGSFFILVKSGCGIKKNWRMRVKIPQLLTKICAGGDRQPAVQNVKIAYWKRKVRLNTDKGLPRNDCRKLAVLERFCVSK